MIALFLDMENDEVRIVTVNGLQDYYRLIGCDCIDIANREIRGKRFDIICDDNGLLKAEPQPSMDGAKRCLLAILSFVAKQMQTETKRVWRKRILYISGKVS